MAKPRLAWFSPVHLPQKPSATISAYVTDVLLPHLQSEFDITVFHNGFESYREFPTGHFLSASEVHAEDPFDFFFYQLEDSPESNFIRQFCGVLPGAVWFHDFLFTSHGPEPILNSPFEDVIKIFNARGGKWRERGFEYKERERSGIREAGLSVLQFFSREIAHSECSRRVKHKLELSSEMPASYYLPLPVAEFGVSKSQEKRICFCGSANIEERAHKVLQAVSDLEENPLLVWLIDADEKKRVEELIREFSVKSVEFVEGRTPENWQRIVASGGIAIHTLFSVYGQMGPYHAISMAAGLPIMVSDFGGAEFLPDSLVFKIQPGNSEAFQIREILHAFLQDDIGLNSENVSEFAKESFDAGMIARELSFALHSSSNVFQEAYSRWAKLSENARQELLDYSLSVNLGRAETQVFPNSSEAVLALEEIYEELGWGISK